MPRCGQCGKVNREGALYCQDCGARIATDADIPKTRVASGSDRAPAASAVGSGMVACPACGVANPAGMSFCKMCGVRLGGPGAAALPAATPSGASPRTTCATCGGQTPANYSFCQNCGARLAPPQPQTGPADAVAPTVAVTPTPPAGMRPPLGAPVPARMPPAATALPGMTAPEPSRRPGSSPPGSSPPGSSPPSARAAATAPRMSPAGGVPAAAGVASAGGVTSVAGTAQPKGKSGPVVSPPRGPAQASPRARLVSVRPDGTDAASCLFEGPAIDLGRTEGTMRFENDPYVAPRHARIERRDGSFLLYPLDWINGVFVRLREPTDLSDGDMFLVGRQLLRFEVPLEAERKARAAVEHGVAVFGSPLRATWGRLRQLTVAALTLDVYYLSRAEIVLGREEGHIRFPDDEHMSRRHAALSEVRGRVRLEDLASSNGTYLKLRAPRELRTGDLIRVGDQLLRFET